MKDNLPLIILIGLPIILLIGALLFKNKPEQKKQEFTKITNETVDNTTETSEANKMTETLESKNYTVTLNTTAGEITLLLTGTKTPKTVSNFVQLAQKGFYDNTIFHRVIDGFMIQGGDPKGDGTGGPGYTFDDEPFNEEYTRGTIAMANRGPNTNGSQFFIMHKDYALPKNYVIFGKVTKGLEIVDKIATAETTVSNSGENSKPVNPVKVLNISVVETK